MSESYDSKKSKEEATIMTKMGIILGLVTLAGLVGPGCVTEATEQEIQSMCENLVKIRGEVDLSSDAELIADVEASFKKEAKRLKDWKARDLKGWDDELAAKLKDIEDEEEKSKLKEEYEKKKQITASKHDPGIDGLGAKKLKAIEAAKKKALENQALFKKKTEECVAKAKKEGVSQKVAVCRIKAKTSDAYWNVCR